MIDANKGIYGCQKNEVNVARNVQGCFTTQTFLLSPISNSVEVFFFFKVLKIKLFSKNPAMLDAIILPRTNWLDEKLRDQ